MYIISLYYVRTHLKLLKNLKLLGKLPNCNLFYNDLLYTLFHSTYVIIDLTNCMKLHVILFGKISSTYPPKIIVLK